MMTARDLLRGAERIELVYRRTRDLEEDIGPDWYVEAGRQIDEVSLGRGDRARLAAAVVSPRVPWEMVLERLPDLIQGRRTPFFGANVGKARRLLAGEPLSEVVDPTTSPKVWDFARNLLGDSRAAVVDVWAARVAGLGDPSSPARYRQIQAAYDLASVRLGVDPATVQWVTWVGARDHGVLEALAEGDAVG